MDKISVMHSKRFKEQSAYNNGDISAAVYQLNLWINICCLVFEQVLSDEPLSPSPVAAKDQASHQSHDRCEEYNSPPQLRNSLTHNQVSLYSVISITNNKHQLRNPDMSLRDSLRYLQLSNHACRLMDFFTLLPFVWFWDIPILSYHNYLSSYQTKGMGSNITEIKSRAGA